MTPGLFDLPAPLLQWVNDRLTGFVPVPVSIALWAVVGAIVCMELYRVVSPQQRIRQIKQEAGTAQKQLLQHDGELQEALPVIAAMLGLSFRRIAIVLPATLVSAYPIVVLIVWMSNTYGHYFPGGTVAIDAAPLQGQWIEGNHIAPPRIQLQEPDGNLVWETPLTTPITVIHKRMWWNLLVANPAGYLPADAPVDQVRIDLPEREIVTVGPGWLRGWEVVFFPLLFIAVLIYKSIRHID